MNWLLLGFGILRQRTNFGRPLGEPYEVERMFYARCPLSFCTFETVKDDEHAAQIHVEMHWKTRHPNAPFVRYR